MSLGRPSSFTKETADKICEQIATTSKGLRSICSQEGMPSLRTVMNWLHEGEKQDSKQEYRDFLQQYARAKDEQADLLVEEMIDIAEHTNEDHTAFTGINVIQRDKLRIETRKWIAMKLKPKKYGDKVDLNHAGTIGIQQITGMEVK
jgi:hypothetical protein